MKRNLPIIQSPPTSSLAVNNFRGVNQNEDPKNLLNNIFSVIRNCFINRRVFEKRPGFTKLGDIQSGVHSEEFTATTNKDATNTTGDWSTDGTANLANNTTNQIDTGSSRPTGEDFCNGRKTVVSSNGTIIVVYGGGGGLKAKRSTDNGATWTNLSGGAGSTAIDASGGSYWSLFIDSSDNIHMSYHVSDNVKYVKLSYSGGNWSVGIPVTVYTADMETEYGYNSIVVDSRGKIWLAAVQSQAPAYVNTLIKSSTDGSTWSSVTTLCSAYGVGQSISLVLNNDNPLIVIFKNVTHSAVLFSKQYNGSSWGSDTTIMALGDDTAFIFSVAKVSDDNIFIGFVRQGMSVDIPVYKYNGTSWSFSTNLLSSANGIGYNRKISLTTDGTNLWAIWTNYESSTQYEIYYQKYNGSSWDSSATDLTNDNGNNQVVVAPERISSVVPMFWGTGSFPTYSLKSKVVQISGVIQSTGYDCSTGSQTFSASITSTLNGGTVTIQYADSADNITFGDWTSDITTLNKRYIKFKITITASSLATGPSIEKVQIVYSGVTVTGGHAFYKTNGDKFLVATFGTNIKYKDVSGNGWTSLGGSLTANKRSFYATFNDLLIHVNSTEAPKKWNGTDASVSNLGGTPPIGKGIEVHINRVWMFADKSSILKWSAFNNAEDWTTAQDAGSVNIYTQDNDYIQGIKSLREQLCVLKENSIHVILGYSLSTFQAYQRSTTAGCVAQGSIQSDGNSIFFLDRDAIYEFDGAYVKPIHLPIIDDIENINQAYVQNASSMIYKNMYFLSFPTGNSTTNNVTWVLDLNDPRRENWVKLDGFNPGFWVVFNVGSSNTPTPYFGDQTANSIVYQFDTGNSDYGQPIDMDIQTKEYGRAEMLNFFKQLMVFLRATTGAYNLAVYYALDGSSEWTFLGNITSSTTDVFQPLQIVSYASTIKFRFRNNEKDQPLTLTRFAIEMSEREFRRT